jgi:predicted RNase H-like nuclease
MRAVLGIDAAWTPTQPSGVALAVELADGWRLKAAAASYQRFHALADKRQPPEERPTGSTPDAPALLASALILCGRPIDLVAIDMPLARTPIVGRRLADDAVSRVYGARKCGTHTPSAFRPGPLSDGLREGFERARYPLQTDRLACPGVIEVYPHPALIEPLGASKRLPYKAAKVRSYWPQAFPQERRTLLYRQWSEITARLEREIAGVEAVLPRLEPTARAWEVKAYEDTLDATVCAWVAICALEGRATPFGDRDAAIWIPTGVSAILRRPQMGRSDVSKTQ